MTTLTKIWEIKQPETGVIRHLQNALQIDEVYCRILATRGIQTLEEAQFFCNPSRDHLHDPFLMKDMEKAAERLSRALESNEHILIYGDYDVDGTTSVALMMNFLRSRHARLDYYIPDRYKEGYGISMAGIEYAHKTHTTLLIALDCGITAAEQIAAANDLGMDVIICDHHLPPLVLPPAYAILNPKQPDCPYPFKELSGCGIGYKFLQALCELRDIPEEELDQFIDLVTISASCDIVPLTGENRTLTYLGLQKINTNPLPCIETLMTKGGRPPGKSPINITDLVFVAGPRINAAGRMADARHAVELLLCTDPSELEMHSEKLNSLNVQRKDRDTTITEDALAMLESDENEIQRYTTVIHSSGWHQGVIGIVASRLTEHYYRPTIVFTETDGKLTGSARSIRGFDIHAAIEKCADLIDHFGGHPFAAGLSLRVENFEAFKEKFEDCVKNTIDEKIMQPIIEIDAELSLDKISDRLLNTIERFAPFGPYNMRPVFVTYGVRDTGNSKVVGKDHIKLHICDSAGNKAGGIAFKQGKHLKLIKNESFDLCFTLEENIFNDQRFIQMNVKDIKPAMR